MVSVRLSCLKYELCSLYPFRNSVWGRRNWPDPLFCHVAAFVHEGRFGIALVISYFYWDDYSHVHGIQ